MSDPSQQRIQCPSCRSQVSALRKSCPACGHQFSEQERLPEGARASRAQSPPPTGSGTKRLLIGVGVVLGIPFVALLIAGIISPPVKTGPRAGASEPASRSPVAPRSDAAQAPGPTAAERGAQEQCEDKITAFVMSKEFVERQLKAPKTAEFPRFTNSQVQVTYLGNCTHEVRAFVDAQNAFGAMLRNNYYVKLRNEKGTDTWTELDVRFIER